MPTEDDLRTALTTLEVEAPDVGTMLATTYRRQHRRTVRRRITGKVAAAAVTMLLAAASIAVPKLLSAPPAPPANPAADLWQYPFALDLAANEWAVFPTWSAEGYNALVFDDAHVSLPLFTVTVLGKDQSMPAGTRALIGRVNGSIAWYRSTGQTREVIWEYATNAWATVRHDVPRNLPAGDIETDLLRYASTVRFDRTTALRVPYRIGYLPAGLRPLGVTDFDFNLHLKGTMHSIVSLTGASPDAPNLVISVQNTIAPALPAGTTKVDYESQFSGTGVRFGLGQVDVLLQSGGFNKKNRLSADELVAIAKSMVPVSDWRIRDTWVDAREAIPIR